MKNIKTYFSVLLTLANIRNVNEQFHSLIILLEKKSTIFFYFKTFISTNK